MSLAERVYREAGFARNPQPLLREARKAAIRERLAERILITWPIVENTEEMLTSGGFDKNMQKEILNLPYSHDRAIFWEHAMGMQKKAKTSFQTPPISSYYSPSN